jgi:hypothetical protein
MCKSELCKNSWFGEAGEQRQDECDRRPANTRRHTPAAAAAFPTSNTPQPEQRQRRQQRTRGIGRSPPPPLRLLLRSESMLKPAPQALSLPGIGGGGR